MFTYCPTCANMLLGKRPAKHIFVWLPRLITNPPAVEITEYTQELRYFCQTCPYVYKITRNVS
jgi:DNA-directed RNA polymerase III subunit RPC11